MARILYGVCGQGFGHSSRSHLIGSNLLDRGHEVLFAASQSSHDYLKQYFPGRICEIMGLSSRYHQGRISIPGTLVDNLARTLVGVRTIRQFHHGRLGEFRPDLVISDFEPFSAWWAWRQGIRYVALDHQSVLTQCRLDPMKGAFWARLLAQLVIRSYYPGQKEHLVLTFFKAEPRRPGVAVAPPVVRQEVLSRTACPKDHILVYSTDASLPVAETLSKFRDQVFFLYGFQKEGREANCIFKKTDTEIFLDDLASCRGVITTAGFSLICESLHFKKKMLLLPIHGQFEQLVNAYYLQKSGMGSYSHRFTEEAVAKFLESLAGPDYQGNNILWPDNDGFFKIFYRKIDTMLNGQAP